jgi:hypothetical protein
MDGKQADIPIVFIPSPTAAKTKADLARELVSSILRDKSAEKIIT